MHQLNPANSLCEAMEGGKERVVTHPGGAAGRKAGVPMVPPGSGRQDSNLRPSEQCEKTGRPRPLFDEATGSVVALRQFPDEIVVNVKLCPHHYPDRVYRHVFKVVYIYLG